MALIGETGKKLHSGRSRNEQIATDLRLFVRDSVDNLRALLGDLLEALLREPGSEGMVCPRTRIYSARSRCLFRTGCWPIWKCFSVTPNDWLDRRERSNLCPLGSGAVTGVTLPLDRALLSRALGFDAADRKQHRRDQ